MAAKKKDPTAAALVAIDRLIAKLRAAGTSRELDQMIRHLVAARNLGAGKPSGNSAISDARAATAKLTRWPDGPKMKEARRRLGLALLAVARPLIEKGYGTPAKPLGPAFAVASGLSADDTGIVYQPQRGSPGALGRGSAPGGAS